MLAKIKKNWAKLALLMAALPAASLLQGCFVTYGGGYYYPTYNNYCYYDYWGYYICDYYYYNGDGSTEQGKDIVTAASSAEEAQLQSAASHYATKFSLSSEQGLKIARTIRDYSTLESRTEKDVAEFANRLYGVSPTRIAQAVSKAQAGQSEELNSVVAEAARNFETSTENMKQIVKTLHGKALEENGINL